MFSLLLRRKLSFTRFGLRAYTHTWSPNSDGTAQNIWFSSTTFNSSSIPNLSPRLSPLLDSYYENLHSYKELQQMSPYWENPVSALSSEVGLNFPWCKRVLQTLGASASWERHGWPFGLPCCHMKMIWLHLMLVQCALLAGLSSGPREECFRCVSVFCCCCVNLLLYKQHHSGITEYNCLSFKDQKSSPTTRHYVQFSCHRTYGNRWTKAGIELQEKISLYLLLASVSKRLCSDLCLARNLN